MFERERFCRGARSEECPVYRVFARIGAPISEDEYWRIWLAPIDETAKDLLTPVPPV